MRNPSLNFEDVLKRLNALAEGTADLPSAQDYPRFVGYLDQALHQVWYSEFWPDLMLVEERLLRDLYSAATAYAKGDEVYFPATQKYYQSLRDANTGNDPATGSPLAENSAYWAECQITYPGSTWAEGVAYSVGDIQHYPPTDQYYQCHTNHTSSSTLTPDATGGDERWGLLTGFNRYIAWAQTGKTVMGDVADVKNADPRVTAGWRSIAGWSESADGVQIPEAVTRVWIQFRKRRPTLFGAAYDETQAYAAGAQVYYTPAAPALGNLYDVITATTAGETPDSAAAKFSLVEIPQSFSNFLVWSAYARHLVTDGKQSAVRGAQAMADQYLDLEADRLYRQSGQTPTLPMRPYPSMGAY